MVQDTILNGIVILAYIYHSDYIQLYTKLFCHCGLVPQSPYSLETLSAQLGDAVTSAE